MPATPTRQRRKEARPGEIAQAALKVFAEKGFAAARMEDIAARAGVSKGVVYLYFADKQDVFHAVVMQAVAPNLERARAVAESFEGPFSEFARAFTHMMGAVSQTTPLGAIAKMVIGESRNFPDLARDWQTNVVEPMLGVVTGVIEKAQSRGEVRPGDPRLFALQLVAPIFMAILWRETFTPVGAPPFDVEQLTRQHLEVLQSGLGATPGGES